LSGCPPVLTRRVIWSFDNPGSPALEGAPKAARARSVVERSTAKRDMVGRVE
jgi:hypothetical protein